MTQSKRCTKLSDINIYTIEHSDEPINFTELYFNDHMRLVVIPTTQSITVISIDLYPIQCRELVRLADLNCVKLSAPNIELCKTDIGIEYKLPIHVVRSEVLLSCIEKDGMKYCEAINLKIFSLSSPAQIMEMCLEDLWQVMNEVRHKCGSQ